MRQGEMIVNGIFSLGCLLNEPLWSANGAISPDVPEILTGLDRSACVL